MSAAGDVTGTITVTARSVDTKNKRRDEYLRAADPWAATGQDGAFDVRP